MKTLAESWMQYLSAVYPDGIHPATMMEARKAFFAGSLTSLKLVVQDRESFESVFNEAREVCEKEIKAVHIRQMTEDLDPYRICECGSGKRWKFCHGKPNSPAPSSTEPPSPPPQG